MCKKSYVTPEMEIVLLNVEDVMSTSGLVDGGTAPEEDIDKPTEGTWGPLQ